MSIICDICTKSTVTVKHSLSKATGTKDFNVNYSWHVVQWHTVIVKHLGPKNFVCQWYIINVYILDNLYDLKLRLKE